MLIFFLIFLGTFVPLLMVTIKFLAHSVTHAHEHTQVHTRLALCAPLEVSMLDDIAFSLVK